VLVSQNHEMLFFPLAYALFKAFFIQNIAFGTCVGMGFENQVKYAGRYLFGE